MEHGLRKQTLFNFIVLCPFFLVFSLLLSSWFDGHKQDFAAYWQAGHMILSGQNVYDRAQWISVRELEGTAFHSEPTFQYPLPLAILFSPLARLPVQLAYTLWMFFAQLAVLSASVVLLSFYPARSGYLDLLTITGIYFFRPMFSVINSGQILTILLLLLALSIRLFAKGNWFFGGFVLSILALKPSIGLPLFIMASMWLLSIRQWKGISGMMLGGFVLVLEGALVNYRWVIDYISVAGNSFQKYYGMHPTLWGAVDKLFKIDSISLLIGSVCAIAVLAIEAYLFWGRKSRLDAFPAFASILPAALLIALYSWNYDQILLTVSIVFLLITISEKYGIGKAALLMVGIVTLAFTMVAVAYLVSHDVWSVLNSFVVWLLSLYFVTQETRPEKLDKILS